MKSNELPSLGESMGEEKPETPKIDPEVLIIPDDTTSTTESGNSSFIFKPTKANSHKTSTATGTTNATIDYYPVVHVFRRKS